MSTNENTVLALEPAVQQWADNMISEWIRKIRMLNIQGDGLANSFISHVQWAARGDMQKVQFAFDYVGKFVDMGVGKGVNLISRDTLISAGATQRRPKPWYTDTFYRQLDALRAVLAGHLADNTQFMIVGNVNDTSAPVEKL